MTLKEQQQQINRMQKRISVLVDEIRLGQTEMKNFKKDVARDMKRAFDQLAENNKVGF